MTERTVVAWDDSVESRGAVAWAIERTRRAARGHEVVLVRVIEAGGLDSGSTIGQEALDAATTAVAAEAARVAHKLPSARVSSQVAVGDPLDVLGGYTGPASLLVVGTEARTHLHFRFAWSIGARLAATALGPVAIVPRHVTGERSGVVVGYVYDDLTLDMLSEEHESIVHDAAEAVRRAHPDLLVTAEAVRGTPARALLDSSPPPRLVVVGCRSRGAVNRFVLGSVSHELILNLDVPVVIVGDRVHESAVVDAPPQLGTRLLPSAAGTPRAGSEPR